MENLSKKYEAIRKAMVALEKLENALDEAEDVCFSQAEAINVSQEVYEPMNDIREIIRRMYENTAAEEAKQSA